MRYFLTLLLALGVLSTQAQTKTKIDFTEYQLDNGLKVLLHQDESAPIVAVTVMYHVGSKNERPDRTGFAHFFEHLLFEGSENIQRGQFDKYVQDAGGVLNANTSFDRTFYYEVLPSNQLELALWLESERMLHAKVEQKGIETQREVVKEERRQRYENQPYGSWLPEVLEAAYQEHPYRWPTIGSMEHLNAAQEEDYKDFYKTFYVPNNAILSIAGNLDIEQTKKWVQQYFGSIPKGTKEIYRPKIVEKPLGKEVRDTVYDNIQLPGVFMAYRIPGMSDPDYYAVQMLSTLLAGGQSSRMYKTLVDEEQKAVQVFNFPLPTEDPGLSVAIGLTNMGVSPKDLEEAMNGVIEKIRNEKISADELQKLRNQIETDFITQNASVVGVAENLANYEMYLGDANLINTELERYMAVTAEDIQRVAKKYFAPNNRVVLVYLPKAQP